MPEGYVPASETIVSADIARARVEAAIVNGETSNEAVWGVLRATVIEGGHRFSMDCSELLAAFLDRDLGLDVAEQILDPDEERYVTEQDKPVVGLALATAFMRQGDEERATKTFFHTGQSPFGFRAEHLGRINDFMAARTNYELSNLS